jgi:hypothetical protein
MQFSEGVWAGNTSSTSGIDFKTIDSLQGYFVLF